ncbi:PP2C family protein-serine/threonine phosphatase [Horticoccus sp. 23ND18S-11]|uniref:PP2C family protein-serine/threonine phosphatase n=1 Tax=Horticoccus sp. 23ND18S-11 TaxID=3391832 RepID=UPI0039C931E9
MPSLRAAALTDIGRVRRKNEDRLLFVEKSMLFGVADGVGGLPGGAEAAQLTVTELTEALQAANGDVAKELNAAVQQANQAVSALGLRISPSMGIGTTLTFGCIRANTLTIAHVGDSRCYGSRDGEFLRLTEDHSVENEARLRRARGEVIYYHEANRNALTRCIGQPTPPEVDIINRVLLPGDRYLFCTDGVTRMLPDSELGELLMESPDPKSALDQIIGLAVRRGGPDNATGVAIFVDAV